MAAPADDARLPGILRLSPATRRCIYWHAGLGPGYQLYGDITSACYNLDGGNGPKPSTSGYSMHFQGLLLSCRAIHVEAVALLYSSNLFTIRYQPRRSLASLRALTPPALAHLATLRVVLNQASCHEQRDGYEGYGDCCMGLQWLISAGPPTISRCDYDGHRNATTCRSPSQMGW